MKMLVVTSCTGEKLYHPGNQLTQADFVDTETLAKREAELAEFKTTAGKIYTGMQHQRLMEGIETLRSAYGKDIVDLYIVSAGYGLISEDREVVPYEVTFNTMNGNAVKEWSQHLGIHHDLGELVQKYDLVLFLLGDKYLKAVGLPFDEVKADQKLVFFASGTSKKMIPNHAPYFFVEVGQEDAKSFSYGLVGLKGYLFKLMATDTVKDDSSLFEKVYSDPGCTLSLLEKHRKIKQPEDHYEQLALFPIGDDKPKKKAAKKEKINPADIYIPETEYAANYTPHMKYFIPEWDDRVDPDYDFLTDTATEGRDPYSHDVYAHEIYPTPNYDGVLISKIIIEQNKTKKARIEEMGVHKFIRFDNGRPIMGDCGAFGYVDEEVPPFETKEILDYYQRLGFDIGVSIDHLIVGKYANDPSERDRRYKLTRANASATSHEVESIKREFAHFDEEHAQFLDTDYLYRESIEEKKSDLIQENILYLLNSIPWGDNQEFIEELGIQASTLTRWKNGKMKPSKYYQSQICKYFGVPDVEGLKTEFLFLGLSPTTVTEKKLHLKRLLDSIDREKLEAMYPAIVKLLE